MRVRQAQASDAPAIAQVHIASWRTTYRGIVPDEHLANLSIERRETYWAGEIAKHDNPQFVLVAEDDTGQVVGFASGGSEREGDPVYTGELYAIYLLAESQGGGLGRALVQETAARLLAAGHRAMLLWVLADNPSRGFYQRLGGQPLRTKTITMGGITLDEVAYGWPTLTTLI
jgi:GNAT superfamily N-acetyltransferase